MPVLSALIWCDCHDNATVVARWLTLFSHRMEPADLIAAVDKTAPVTADLHSHPGWFTYSSRLIYILIQADLHTHQFWFTSSSKLIYILIQADLFSSRLIYILIQADLHPHPVWFTSSLRMRDTRFADHLRLHTGWFICNIEVSTLGFIINDHSLVTALTAPPAHHSWHSCLVTAAAAISPQCNSRLLHNTWHGCNAPQQIQLTHHGWFGYYSAAELTTPS